MNALERIAVALESLAGTQESLAGISRDNLLAKSFVYFSDELSNILDYDFDSELEKARALRKLQKIINQTAKELQDDQKSKIGQRS